MAKTRRRAPVSGPGAQQHMYVIEHPDGKAGGTFYVRDIWRVPKLLKAPWSKKLIPIVEYKTGLWQRHHKSEMPALLKMIKKKQYDHDHPVYCGRTFNPKRDGLLDFVIEWKGPVRQT